MRISTFTAYAFCAAGALAQTPPGTSPSTNITLGVNYGTTSVTPNILLPESLVATQPTLYSNASYPSTYMLLLIDLSIPSSSLTSTLNLVPGLQANRTTRLHWWNLDVTQLSNGTFSIPISNSTSAAAYDGPKPQAGDIAHTYTFYLLPQPSNYTLPAAVKAGLYYPATTSARMNFSIEALAAIVGEPLAATWIRVQNTSVATTANSSTTTTTAAGTAAVNATAKVSGANATMSSAASATSAIYTGTACRILAANAALFAVGICMFVWL